MRERFGFCVCVCGFLGGAVVVTFLKCFFFFFYFLKSKLQALAWKTPGEWGAET